MSGRGELRPVSDGALHVTVVFLGPRRQALVEAVWETAVRAVAGLSAPALRPREATWVPPRRARLLAVDLEDRGGQAARLQGALSAALVTVGLHEAERRPFWPHVTLARVRGRAKVQDRGTAPVPGTPFRAPGLTLYRSDLHPAGARYVALERLELPED